MKVQVLTHQKTRLMLSGSNANCLITTSSDAQCFSHKFPLSMRVNLYSGILAHYKTPTSVKYNWFFINSQSCKVQVLQPILATEIRQQQNNGFSLAIGVALWPSNRKCLQYKIVHRLKKICDQNLGLKPRVCGTVHLVTDKFTADL